MMQNQPQYPIYRQPAPAPQAKVQQPAQWQPVPVAALPPAKVRGVMAEQTAKCVLRTPAALGRADVAVAQPSDPKTTVDWNQVQARMERLNVLRYQKERLPSGGVQ